MSAEKDLFERTIRLPRPSLTNWALLAEVAELFEPYASADRMQIQAMDSRGRIPRASVEALRSAVEARGENPTEVRFDVFGQNETYFYLGIHQSSHEADGRFLSLDESVVTHVLTRIQEIFAHHAKSIDDGAVIPPPEPTPAARALAPAAVEPSTRENSRLREFFGHAGEPPRWERILYAVLAVSGGVVATVLTIVYAGS